MRHYRFTIMALLGVLFFLWNNSAWSIGVGQIGIYSTLGQPLDAEIPLIGAKRADLFNLQAYLASPEKFPVNKKSTLLGQLRFKPVLSSRNQPIIHVTTPNVISEPYVQFVLEVVAGGNHLFRQYTILLDPAGYRRPRVPPVRLYYTAPDASAGMGLVDQAEPAAAASTNQPALTTPEPAPTPLKHYGPTRADDTLYSIARKMRPNDSVTLDQTMIAIVEANPNAFHANHTNQLKEGVRLVIPSVVTIAAINPDAAEHAVARNGGILPKPEITAKPHASLPTEHQSEQTIAEPKPLILQSPSASHIDGPLPNNLTKLFNTPPLAGTENAIINQPTGATTDQLIVKRLAETDNILQKEEHENQLLTSEVAALEKQNKQLQNAVAAEQKEIHAIEKKAQSNATPKTITTTVPPAVSQFDDFGKDFFTDTDNIFSNRILIVLLAALALLLLILILLLLRQFYPQYFKFLERRVKMPVNTATSRIEPQLQETPSPVQTMPKAAPTPSPYSLNETDQLTSVIERPESIVASAVPNVTTPTIESVPMSAPAQTPTPAPSSIVVPAPASTLKFADRNTTLTTAGSSTPPSGKIVDEQEAVFELEVPSMAPISDDPNSALSVDDKIDLAQTYVSMGDLAAARELLHAAVAEGTEMQKAWAQRLLDQL